MTPEQMIACRKKVEGILDEYRDWPAAGNDVLAAMCVKAIANQLEKEHESEP